MAIRNFIKGMPTVVWLSAIFVFIPLSPAAAQDIYKTVDENGNTVYTDQKPSADAQPVKLKELTVVDALELGGDQIATDDSENAENGESAPDFDIAIVTPEAGGTVWNTAYVLSVQVETGRELPSGTRLAYLIDGEVRSTTRALSVELEEVYRGEHQLSVELRSSNGQVLAGAGPITFFMRQHSRLHPNPG